MEYYVCSSVDHPVLAKRRCMGTAPTDISDGCWRMTAKLLTALGIKLVGIHSKCYTPHVSPNISALDRSKSSEGTRHSPFVAVATSNLSPSGVSCKALSPGNVQRVVGNMQEVGTKEPNNSTSWMGWRWRYRPWETKVKYPQPEYNSKAQRAGRELPMQRRSRLGFKGLDCTISYAHFGGKEDEGLGLTVRHGVQGNVQIGWVSAV